MDDATIAARLRDGLLAGDRVPADLLDRLARDAAAAGLHDVVHRTVDSPVGVLLVAATPTGVVRVAFDDHGAALDDLAVRVSPRVVPAGPLLDDVARQLDEWFTGDRHEFDLALDWQLSHGFRREVLRRLGDLAWGETASYGQVAALAARPRAARAVGTACATNPVPILVPCHRVVRADGSPGEYAGGRAAKRWLLAHEAAEAVDPGAP